LRAWGHSRWRHHDRVRIQLFVGERLGATSGVDDGTLCRCVAEGGDEGREAVGVLVSQMLAFVLTHVGVSEVDSVHLSAPAHRDVDPFPVDAVAGDGVGTSGRGTLGLVAAEGVPPVEVTVVEVTVVEVPLRHPHGSAFAVEADGDRSAVGVDAGDGGEVAVEDAKPGTVLEAHDSVTRLEVATVGVHRRSAKQPGLGGQGAGALVEFVNGGVAMIDEQHLGRVADLLDVAVPGIECLIDRVVVGARDVDFAAPVVHHDRPGTPSPDAVQ